MSDDKYNGWTNYETWATALWIGNDESEYKYWRDKARECYAEAEERPGWSKVDAAKGQLADSLRRYMNEQSPDLGAGLWSDLLNAALSEVDWHEIAGDMIDEVKDDEQS